MFRRALDKGIGDGVRKGLEAGFAPGGPVAKAMDEAFRPVREEMTRLRRIEALYRWAPISTLPAQYCDGRGVLVSRHGDIMFAAWRDDDGGYWDADIEYGGTPIEPAPTHWFALPKAPSQAARNASPQSDSQGNGTSP